MKVEVLVATYRGANPRCFTAISVACSEANRHGIQTIVVPYGTALLHASRNEALAKMEGDYAVMIDDDMLPEPEAIVKLLAHQAPVATALCTTRGKPVQLAVKEWHEESCQFINMDKVAGYPVTGKFGVGAAFLAIRKDTVEALVEHYLSANDWVMDRAREHRRMKVQEFRIEEERKHIEGLRRHWYEKDSYVRIFDHPIDETQMQMGEDIGFSNRLMQLKIPVLIDPTINVGHVGDYVYGLKDYVPETATKLRRVDIGATFDKLKKTG